MQAGYFTTTHILMLSRLLIKIGDAIKTLCHVYLPGISPHSKLSSNPLSLQSFLLPGNPPNSDTLPGATSPDQGVYSKVLCGRGSCGNGEMPCQCHI